MISGSLYTLHERRRIPAPMATNPIETILNRDLSRVNAKELIDRFCPLLDEITNYGTHLYKRATNQKRELLTPEGVPYLIYLHVLEMTDATSEMLRQSTVSPAIPVVRATFESTLALLYMFETDTTNRATAWLVAYLMEQLEWINMMLGTEKAGQQLHQAMQTDTVGANIDLSSYAAIATKQKSNLEALLAKPELAVAVAERAEIIRKNPRNQHPNWYNSFGGPANLRGLSKHLNREAQYLVLYKAFSGLAHGQNLRRFITRAASPNPLVRLLRDSTDFHQLATIAVTLAARCTRILSEHEKEKDQYAKWYAAEIGFVGDAAAAP